MSQEDTPESPQTIGAFLREHREKSKATLDDVAESTKISLPILRAIEEDDYDRMPAEAFCRGFYSMYADFLQLNSEEIVTRYLESRGQPSRASQKQARPPIKKSKHFSTYAEPAAVSPAASLGMLLLAGLIVLIGIYVYFDWNPTQYISAQLSPSPIVEEPVRSEIETPPVSDSESLTNETSPDSDGATAKQVPAGSPLEVLEMGPYHLEIDFTSNGTLNVTLDDAPVIEKNFTSGETLQWNVKEKFLLDLPEEISATLRLNGVEQALPEAENGRRFLLFPEGLPD